MTPEIDKIIASMMNKLLYSEVRIICASVTNRKSILLYILVMVRDGQGYN